jgi:hypothetical protein
MVVNYLTWTSAVNGSPHLITLGVLQSLYDCCYHSCSKNFLSIHPISFSADSCNAQFVSHPRNINCWALVYTRNLTRYRIRPLFISSYWQYGLCPCLFFDQHVTHMLETYAYVRCLRLYFSKLLIEFSSCCFQQIS